MTRTIETENDTYEINDYIPEHYPENQNELFMDVIPVNPLLRNGFDNTPNEFRDPLELKHWWGRPYICSDETDDKLFWVVRCLNGGAWDRSSGIAYRIESKDEALEIAKTALKKPVYKTPEKLDKIVRDKIGDEKHSIITADEMTAPNPFAKFIK